MHKPKTLISWGYVIKSKKSCQFSKVRTLYCTLLRPWTQALLLRKKWSCQLIAVLKNIEASCHSFFLCHIGPELQRHFEMEILRLQHRCNFQIPAKRVFESRRLVKTHTLRITFMHLAPSSLFLLLNILHACSTVLWPLNQSAKHRSNLWCVGLEAGRELCYIYIAGTALLQECHDQMSYYISITACLHGSSTAIRSDSLFHNQSF